MITWKKRQLPSLYLFIYRLMKEKSNNHLFIKYSAVRELFNRRFNKIPKKYHYFVLKEMEELKLIKKIGGRNSVKFIFTGKDTDKLLNQLLFPF